MTDRRDATAERLLCDATALCRIAGSVDEINLIEGLRIAARAEAAALRFQVDTVALLLRDGVFAAHGQKPIPAVVDLLRVEYPDARRLITAAEHTRPRVDLQGQVLPPRLPATAAALDAGDVSLRHVEVIARLLDGAAARRLDPGRWAAAETELATQAADTTPTKLRDWGTQLIDALDQDGAEPDDAEPEPVNELRLARNPRGGGWVKARFDDAAMYDVIASVLDAKAAPLTAEDDRPVEQRQAEAMAEVFGWVADHADTTIAPSSGGRRPHVNVLVRLEDLQNRASAACLDFGGTLDPAALRQLCCDAAIIPIVLGGASQPLDVGRATRTIPDGLRRAVAARDRGCAHPGCSRPVSWCQIHHIVEWEHGGETKLSNLVMVCLVHHAQAHSAGWDIRIGADGIPEFFPPAWIDPERRPRRNPPAYPAVSSDGFSVDRPVDPSRYRGPAPADDPANPGWTAA